MSVSKNKPCVSLVIINQSCELCDRKHQGCLSAFLQALYIATQKPPFLKVDEIKRILQSPLSTHLNSIIAPLSRQLCCFGSRKESVVSLECYSSLFKLLEITQK
jgi:hypothetical protein